MSNLSDLLASGTECGCHPWRHVLVSPAAWQAAARMLSVGDLTLLAHWGEEARVHAAVRDVQSNTIAILSFESTEKKFPSLGAHHPPAIRLERAIRDVTGLVPVGAPDERPWLDHGAWPASRAAAKKPYSFLPSDGESLHQIPVGPVHAGIIEPGHFRFTCSGETIVRLEARLGYLHRGIAGLMAGATLAQAAKLAARISGDSTVAYSLAFAQSVEAACGVSVPPRALWLRALMLELERLANHFGDVGGVCNDAAFCLILTHCGILRERVLRTSAAVFGHRLTMDRVVPGGVAADIDADGVAALKACADDLSKRLPGIVSLYEDTASLQDRTVRTGIVRQSLVEQFGAGGFVGRAAGREFDARKVVPTAPYDTLDFKVPVLFRGDVDARVRIRLAEIEQSLSLVGQILDTLPSGEILTSFACAAGEGAALVEGFRGDVFVWVRTKANGTVERAHLRDPSWFQWPLLEAAIEGNIVADFPLCNKSFNCSYAGVDL